MYVCFLRPSGYPFLNVSSFFCGPSVSCGQCVWVLNTSAFGNSSDSDGTVTTPATYIDNTSVSCISPPLVKLLPSLPDSLHSKYQVTVYVYYTQNAQVLVVVSISLYPLCSFSPLSTTKVRISLSISLSLSMSFTQCVSISVHADTHTTGL